jgi:hypothetical protein
MGANGSMPVGLVASTLREADPADDQAGESRGEQPGRRRVRRQRTAEKGRSRNLVIPDSLYDMLFIYARRTKIKTTSKRRVNGIVVGTKEGTRSLTVSEATCDAIADYLKKKGMLDDDDKAPAAD